MFKKSILQNVPTAINKRTHTILTSSLMEAYKASIFFKNDKTILHFNTSRMKMKMTVVTIMKEVIWKIIIDNAH